MSTMLPLPPLARFAAPPTWRCIEFISDLHLAAETPRTFEAWVQYMSHSQADAICILGDLVEVWVGDDARTEGFEAQFSAALRHMATQRWVGFMVGNRDFLVGDALLQSCGVHALADPCLFSAFGEQTLLTHGDALCIEDTAYQSFRTQVRSAQWQAQFLSQPLAARRAFARAARQASEARHQEQRGNAMAESWADVDPPSASHWLMQAGATSMVHGHTHRPGSTALPCGHLRHVLTDWDLDHAPHRAEVMQWTRLGWERRALTTAE